MKALRRPGLLLTTLLAAACSDPTGFPALRDGAGTTTLLQTYFSGLPQAARLTVSTPTGWDSVWIALQGTVSPTSPPPAVDFSTQLVLVVALGTKRTGGYVIHIDSLADTGGTRTVFVTTLQPGGGCIVTDVETAPAHAVVADRGPATIVFHERSLQYDCQ